MEEDDNIIRRWESLYPDRKFSVVVPFAKADDGQLDLTDVMEGNAFPNYIEAQSEPFRSWEAGQYLWGGAGTLSEVVDGLVYFGNTEDETIRPTEAFYEKHTEYKAELERRRGLKRRLKRTQSYN
jgi:hypothetical protein